MRKLGALFQNEMIKSAKKISVYIIVIVMTLGMIGCSVFIKETDGSDSVHTSYETNRYDADYIKSLEEQIRNYDELLQSGKLTAGETERIREQLYSIQIEYLYADIYGNFARENKIGVLNYRYSMLGELAQLREQLLSMAYYDGDTSSEQYQAYQKRYDELESVLKIDDYAQYIQTRNRQIEEDVTMTEAQKQAAISFNESLLLVCPTGEYATYQEKVNAETLLNEKSQIDASLENNVDLNSGGNLTPERRTVLEKDLKLINAKIKNGFLKDDPDGTAGDNAYNLSLNLGSVFSIVILIILAGAMMSHEMSTGTIKSLIIAPVKRWKIYLAKYLSLIVTLLLLLLYTYAVTSLTDGLLFGFGSFGRRTFLVAGNPVTMNYFVFQLLSTLFNVVPLLVITTFAYMLSIVTKNTAASVSVSIGLYLGGSFIHLLLVSSLSGYEYLVKFLPFSNLNLFDKVFYTAASSGNSAGLLWGNIADTGSTSLVFSLFYIIIILVCMISVGLDHFCRRDIK